jgi:hypothetical protein
VIFWYGIVPISGTFVNRYKWRQFRRRFDELRLRPLLDYSRYRRIDGDGAIFRFTGGFESVTDGLTLWIQGENLTMPVSLANVRTWLLPKQEGEDLSEDIDPGEEMPERIRWDRISTLTEGARVFVGGALRFQDERWCFVSTKETPLMVIFYDCPDRALTPRVIRTGRYWNEYWNPITPYSLVIGAICQILIAVSFLNRPAFRLTVITALTALFTPLYPLIPPGLLFTVLFRRIDWRARVLRVYRDLARLPLPYLAPGRETGRLPPGKPADGEGPSSEAGAAGGEIFGFITRDSLPAEAGEETMPFLLPEYLKRGTNTKWYIFGAIRPGSGLPVRPGDPFAAFGILPGKPEALARRYAITAYTLEAIAWLALLAGIGLNILFIRIVLTLL